MLKHIHIDKLATTLKNKVHILMTYPISLIQVSKWGIFTVFAILFMGNSLFYQSLVGKINDELIGPYRQADSPLNSFIQITKTLTPTIVIENITETIAPTQVIPTKKPVQKKATISEDELWQALTIYRNSNGKKELLRSDKLCQYARKRASELADRLTTKPEDPLDEHVGFKRDADSGYLFDFTGFNQIGENLAYTPSYTTGTQVIEWGWDSSSGHRALQLSDTVTHGCLTGIHPIYVGIFGS